MPRWLPGWWLAEGVGNVAGARLGALIAAGGSSIQLGVRAFFSRGCVGEREAGFVPGGGVLAKGRLRMSGRNEYERDVSGSEERGITGVQPMGQQEAGVTRPRVWGLIAWAAGAVAVGAVLAVPV